MSHGIDPSIAIRPLDKKDLPDVQRFCDENIGKNYYSSNELNEVFEKSLKSDVMCSFVLEAKEETTEKAGESSTRSHIIGVRLTYAPALWNKGKGKGISPNLWKVEANRVGYFQSLFISDRHQGGGWGKKLSEASIGALKKLGTQAIVTHSWKESPNNSSQRYLTNMGFEFVASHPQYWKDVDYVCTRDGKPCLCTAEEMILYLEP